MGVGNGLVGVGNGLVSLNKVKSLENRILFSLRKTTAAGNRLRGKKPHSNLRHLARSIKKLQLSKDLGSLSFADGLVTGCLQVTLSVLCFCCHLCVMPGLYHLPSQNFCADCQITKMIG